MQNMDEKQKEPLQEMTQADGVKNETTEAAKPSSGSVFEGVYERLPDISVRAVDRFIAICVTALILVVLFGIFKANHLFGL